MYSSVPYHRLARTASHRWWRPVVGTLVLVVSWFVAVGVVYAFADAIGMVVGRPVGADGVSDWGDTGGFGVELLTLGALIPCVALAAWWVQRRRPGTVSSVQGRLRLGWLGVCLMVAVPAMALILVADTVLSVLTTGPTEEVSSGGGWVGAGPFAAALLMLLVLVPLQTAAEEYLCRGWLLQAVGAFVRAPWLPIGVQAVAFAAIHGAGTPWGFIDLILFGAVTGWLVVRTGGLEAAIALHLVNNLVAMGASAAFGELTSSANAADAQWQILAVDLAMFPLYAAAITWLARRRDLVTAAAVPAAPDPVLESA
ncbi:type II CAAX endopeptidase family protein [Dactylosporangium sp. NPDC005555]|uniref:CPBP family intramembrane glutamic endopeptidase n=1 Tax=Dactylosporangium sp. NPDC005555 TaxID=3154889 RepID=UPI0033BEF004